MFGFVEGLAGLLIVRSWRIPRSASLGLFEFVVLLEDFLWLRLGQDFSCSHFGFLLNFPLLVLTHEPLLSRSRINVVFMGSYILQFLELHLCLPHDLLLPFLTQNDSHFLIETIDGLLALLDRLLVDVESEQPVTCSLWHSLELQALSIVAERQGCSNVSCSGCSPDSMDVLGEVCGQFKIDDCLDLLDIQSSGCQICSQQVVILLFLEVMKSLNSLSLA